MKRFVNLSSLLFAALYCTAGLAIPEVAVTAESRDTFKKIVEFTKNNHYRTDVTFNNKHSQRVHQALLKYLSPDKGMFTQGQVNLMSKSATELDEALQSGDPTPGVEIYNAYLQAQERKSKTKMKWADGLTESSVSAIVAAVKERNKKPEKEKEFEELTWPKSDAELRNTWKKEFDDSVTSLHQQDYTVTEIQASIKDSENSMIKDVNSKGPLDAMAAFANANFHLMDPHTTYMPPKKKEEFSTGMRLSFFGIGAKLKKEKRYVTIDEVIGGGPAAKQGEIRDGSRIVGVKANEQAEYEKVVGWTTDDVVKLIRGPENTPVWISYLEKGDSESAKPKTVEIIRGKVDLEEASASLKYIDTQYKGETVKVAVMRIPSFYADFEAIRAGDPNAKRVAVDVKRLLYKIHMDKVDRLIIDLRNNGGGSLGDVIAMIGFFIPDGVGVYTKDSDGVVEDMPDLDGGTILYGGLLSVLVNGGSASASEIFAGAIQDYQRGWVFGGQTFGKGSVQTVKYLGEVGAVKYTNMQFFLPMGSSTQGRGVIPDAYLPSPYLYLATREEDLPNALPFQRLQKDQVKEPSYMGWAGDFSEQIARDIEARHNQNPDLVFLQAYSVLFREGNPLKGETLNKKIYDLEMARRQQKGEKTVSYKQFKKDDDAEWWLDKTLDPGKDPLVLEAAWGMDRGLELYSERIHASMNEAH